MYLSYSIDLLILTVAGSIAIFQSRLRKPKHAILRRGPDTKSTLASSVCG